MSKEKEFKNNVMRTLEEAGIAYKVHEYPHVEGEAVDGQTVAQSLGQDPMQVYKTLVAAGGKGAHYVFVVPVCENLDLKKAARAVGEKAVELVAVKELLPLTGYVRGGCSPIGMKKKFPTVYSDFITMIDTVMVSAGRIGWQIELSPEELIRITDGNTADILM